MAFKWEWDNKDCCCPDADPRTCSELRFFDEKDPWNNEDDMCDCPCHDGYFEEKEKIIYE